MEKKPSRLLSLIAVVILSLGTTGCLETNVASQVMSRLLDQETCEWCRTTYLDHTGEFAQNNSQEREKLGTTIERILRDPLNSQSELSNLSWNEYSLPFMVSQNSRPLLIILQIDWQTFNGPNQLGGTYNIDIKDPEGRIVTHAGEVVEPDPMNQNEGVDVVVQLAVVEPQAGIWSAEVSGSGFDGPLANTYRGDFQLQVRSIIPCDPTCIH